jgi:hypothetical protein
MHDFGGFSSFSGEVMGFRFHKSFGGRGFRLNLSKSGPSFSLGAAPFTVNFKAGRRTMYTFSLPGTGMSWRWFGGGRRHSSGGYGSGGNYGSGNYSPPELPSGLLPLDRSRLPGRFNRIEPTLTLPEPKSEPLRLKPAPPRPPYVCQHISRPEYDSFNNANYRIAVYRKGECKGYMCADGTFRYEDVLPTWFTHEGARQMVEATIHNEKIRNLECTFEIIVKSLRNAAYTTVYKYEP